MSDFGQISSVFHQNEIDKLVSMFEKLPDQLNFTQAGQRPRAYTNGIDQRHILYKWLSDRTSAKIEECTGQKCLIHVAMYLKEFNPWTVHSDYIKGDLLPGYAFLIPVDWEGPDDAVTHTVIFNERSTTTLDDYLKNSFPKNNNASYLNKSLCSHVEPEVLENLTLGMAAKWERGDVIYWKRDLLHSSDNFIASGITMKKAIVIFSTN